MNTNELLSLLGALIDSEEVHSFLEKHPSFRVERPSDGRQYVISHDDGVDLLFEPDEGPSGGKTKHLRKCQTLFLYAEGKDGHKAYKGQIPLGFKLSDTRKELLDKKTPQRTWKIGEGEVGIDHPNPSHDRWETDEVFVSANYSKKTGNIMYFIVTRRKA